MHPWEEISLSDYEQHMSLDSVMQLQTLDSMMKDQLGAYPADTVMILGVAGGNGLGHIDTAKYRKVYGVDINAEYLRAVKDRYPALDGVLECIRADLTDDTSVLPTAGLLIADLLIEYIGFDAFKATVSRVSPGYVSCIIQVNTDEEGWVSDSPYLHAFDRLDEVHHQIGEDTLTKAMADIGYRRIYTASEPLPNGKALLRADYGRTGGCP